MKLIPLQDLPLQVDKLSRFYRTDKKKLQQRNYFEGEKISLFIRSHNLSVRL